MRIFEILLPKGMSDKSLSQQRLSQIRDIQTRMNKYVDAIYSPGTSPAGKEFLKARLRDEYGHLKSTLHIVAENEIQDTTAKIQYEVYDRKTGLKVPGRGPYNNRQRARIAVDQLDNKYGAYRYGYRPIAALKEAVHTVPITPKDFKAVKTLFENPIPAGIAPIFIQDLIDDDELFEQFESIELKNPGQDVRPLIADWIKRVMPDQMYNFTDDAQTMAQKNGVLSPIHGYDSKSYTGTNDPITGDAYGSF